MRATEDDETEAAEVERLIAECQKPSVRFDAGPPFRLRPGHVYFLGERDRSLQYAAAGALVLVLSAVLVGGVVGWAVSRL